MNRKGMDMKMKMKVRPGVNVFCEGGRPLCRVHRLVFSEDGRGGEWSKDESRYYCDGPAAKLAEDHPLFGIGDVPEERNDPITGWFKTAQEAVDEWKRLKRLKRPGRKAKSVSKKGVPGVGRTADNRRRV